MALSKQLIAKFETLSTADLIRLQIWVSDRCEAVKESIGPSNFASARWSVINPEKASKNNRIQYLKSQQEKSRRVQKPAEIVNITLVD